MNRRVSVPVTGEFHQDINAVIAGMVERQQRTTVNPPWKGAECLFENITTFSSGRSCHFNNKLVFCIIKRKAARGATVPSIAPGCPKAGPGRFLLKRQNRRFHMFKYHMTKAEREVTVGEELSGLLKRGKYASIAMCRRNEPYIVTLSYGYDEQARCLYFHTANKGLKLDFLKENSNACATVVEDGGYLKDQCSHLYFSLVISGQMTVVSDLEEKKHAMEVLLNHLEDNPGPIRQRNLPHDAAYSGVAMLRLTIGQLSGKRGG
jgi:nitroimidazol reductase NimA-like FMN-containing flavoprotein (pyridoxamine 5'-phosphate oxidase superfamily)